MRSASTYNDAHFHVASKPQGLDHTSRDVIRVATPQRDKCFARNCGNWALPIVPSGKLVAEQRVSGAQQESGVLLALDIQIGICAEVLIQNQFGRVFTGVAVIIEKEQS